ncbi:unnamed protein product [Paramecium sonneborni]|uniref:Uncharacterized protein n=1 Tax=Paramecium sonneborni TaxID=65129 RepID=A0A8S1LT07_9CILI|nr:unnamed protein product [Paramecium sonneborni]
MDFVKVKMKIKCQNIKIRISNKKLLIFQINLIKSNRFIRKLDEMHKKKESYLINKFIMKRKLINQEMKTGHQKELDQNKSNLDKQLK